MSKNKLIGAVIAGVAAAAAAAGVAYADYVISQQELVLIGSAFVTAALAYVKKPAE